MFSQYDLMKDTGLDERPASARPIAKSAADSMDRYSGRFGDPFGFESFRKAASSITLEAGCRVRNRRDGRIGKLFHLAAGAPVRGAFVEYDNGDRHACEPGELERL